MSRPLSVSSSTAYFGLSIAICKISLRFFSPPEKPSLTEREVKERSMVLDSGSDPSKAAGNTLIFYKQRDHWAWTIPIAPNLISIGVVAPAAYFKEQGLNKTEYLRKEMMTLNPDLTRRITNTSFAEEVRSVTSYSYSTTDYAGKGFICVGDSHGDGFSATTSSQAASAWGEARRLGYEAYKKKLIAEGKYRQRR